MANSTKDIDISQKLQPGSLKKVDPVAALYCSIYKKSPRDDFGITIFFKEALDQEVLQRALDDVIARLPFINCETKKGFLFWYHKLIDKKIIVNSEEYSLLRVWVEGNHLTLMTAHSVCDGRGLSKIVTTLCIRYFELLGIEVDKTGFIDCEQEPSLEEFENAYVRYAKTKRRVFGKNKRAFKRSYIATLNYFKSKRLWKMAYKNRLLDLKAPRMPLKYVFNMPVDVIKQKAYQYGATINEYIVAHIFKAIADERNKNPKKCAHKKPISMNIPYDIRTYFPSKTFRIFTDGVQIMMPETNDIREMIQGLKEQFCKIDADYVLADVKMIQGLCWAFCWVPRAIKSFILRRLGGIYSRMLSANFSNIGLVKMPKQVQEKIECFEIVSQTYPFAPFNIGCASINNVLSLTLFNPINEEVFADFDKRLLESAI